MPSLSLAKLQIILKDTVLVTIGANGSPLLSVFPALHQILQTCYLIESSQRNTEIGKVSQVPQQGRGIARAPRQRHETVQPHSARLLLTVHSVGEGENPRADWPVSPFKSMASKAPQSVRIPRKVMLTREMVVFFGLE